MSHGHIQCPGCGAVLQINVPLGAGQNVVCPSCSTPLNSPIPPNNGLYSAPTAAAKPVPFTSPGKLSQAPAPRSSVSNCGVIAVVVIAISLVCSILVVGFGVGLYLVSSKGKQTASVPAPLNSQSSRPQPVNRPGNSSQTSGLDLFCGDASESTAMSVRSPSMGNVAMGQSRFGETYRFDDLGWAVTSLAFSPDGQFLVAGKMDRTILVFDLGSGTMIHSYEKLDGLGKITSLSFTPNGEKLLSCGQRGRIEIWDFGPKGDLESSGRFVGHSQEVVAMAVSKDGQHVLSGGNDKLARFWHLESGREVFAVGGFQGSVKAAFISADKKQGLATDGQTLLLIDLEKGEAIQSMELTRSYMAQTASIAPDGSRVIVSDLYSLRLWETRTGKEYERLQEQEIQWSSTFSPDGMYLLSSGRAKVNVWDVASQSKIYEFDTTDPYYVQAIAFSPDNRHFAAFPSSAGQDLFVFRLPDAK